MRPAWLLLLVGSASCTAANPTYIGQGIGGCTPGLRSCVGSRPVLCDAAGMLANQTCQSGAACDDGRCVAPTGAAYCGNDASCSSGRVCTAVVDPALPTSPGTLTMYCLPPDGVAEGAQACTAGQQCRSGLCLPTSAGSICLRACQLDNDCPPATFCLDFNVEITGVRGTIRGCRSP